MAVRPASKVNSMTDAAGYILVGGKSSRLGRDKALIEVGGTPLVLRVAHAMRAAVEEVALVGSPEKYNHLGLRVIPDPITGFGPLAGILAALEDSSRQWNLIAACDMPNLTAEFLRFLLRRAAEEQAEVLLPADENGRAEPLCAVYASCCRAAIRRAVEAGRHKITGAFEGLRVITLNPADYDQYGEQGDLFANLNTEDDLARAGLGPRSR